MSKSTRADLDRGHIPAHDGGMARRGRRRRRRSDAIMAAMMRGRWDDGPESGPGTAGVREPRRPKPSPSSMQAALPEPVGAAR
jgi:hypothetical protein